MKVKALRVLAVVGTRPEVVKMAPVLRRLRRRPGRFTVRLCVTAQHRQLLDGMLADFGLKPDVDLDLMRPGQSVSSFLAAALPALRRVIARERPRLILAQGDTASVLASALAACDAGVPFGHIEAGLRSFDKRLPYPEENIRVLADRLSDLLFAPTPAAGRNLIREGIDRRRIFITGNTAVDAILEAKAHPRPPKHASLRALPPGARVVTVTLHRRETQGAPLERIFKVLLRTARRYPEVTWIYPVHPAPRVRSAARRLLRHPRILLLPPLCYHDFVGLMGRSEFIVTDSGGVQEEAPSLGKRVLVLRDKTERPEALGKAGARLVGVSAERLFKELADALERRPSGRPPRINPFGDGRASERIVRALESWSRPRTA